MSFPQSRLTDLTIHAPPVISGGNVPVREVTALANRHLADLLYSILPI